MKPILRLAPILIALLGSGAAAASPHSPNVVAAQHSPASPARGDTVTLLLDLADASNVSFVRAIYCRVQGYACAPALNMTYVGEATYANGFEAAIGWRPSFFRGVTTVGYRFEIHYANHSMETTPTFDYPSKPPELPPHSDTYYFYGLPAESKPAPDLASSVGLAVLGLVAWSHRK